MIHETNTLVLSWVPVTDSAGRTTMEARWLETTQPGTPQLHPALHHVHAA